MIARALFLLPASLGILFTSAPAGACDCEEGPQAHRERPASRVAAAGSPSQGEAQVVSIAVTADGFVPAQVTAKRGRPVKLEVLPGDRKSVV